MLELTDMGTNRIINDILVVEDDTGMRNLLVEILETQGFQVFSASNLIEARQHIQTVRKLDSLILDYTLPDGTGISIIEGARKRFPDLSVILISGASPELLQEQASKYHLDMVIHKPFNPMQLVNILNTRFDMI